ncbi:aspartate aminotransferase family protein [Chthonobacter rhizosphaerae]|uniref:aspartate aminotransferase family protein n=1 Tax=Chthonobacter rhizosphaerae TaxID=2735553 RepID=UPI0015EE900B|nr:aspartate aminotransferase family protein [Chthonobacter rhizosphaerae]
MAPPSLTSRAAALLTAERGRFADRNPKSRALAESAGRHFPGGVPLHWMKDWGTPFPLAVAEASGAEVLDADGHRLADFCLGDTGAMFGHAPAPVVEAIRAAAGHGLTAMMPSTGTAAVGDLLAEVFALPFWQVTQTASDANRAVIRWARAITGRPRILVFEGCYHGQVDDAFVARGPDGRTVVRPGLLGQVADVAATTVCCPFNDLPAVEAALAAGDVALVLTEPALTNTAMVLPAPGFLDGLAAACRRAGTLLCLDETHTISTARGGYARAHGLKPDFLVVGKPVAGGLPAAVFGFTADVEAAMRRADAERPAGYSGIGTTLSGNMLQLAAMRATLEDVMTPEAYGHMLALSDRLAAELSAAITRHGLPWSVTRLGARAEIVHSPTPLTDGAHAAATIDHDLEAAIHIALLNREVIVTPFHNMTLVSPATTAAHVGRLAEAFDDTLTALLR